MIRTFSGVFGVSLVIAEIDVPNLDTLLVFDVRFDGLPNVSLS